MGEESRLISFKAALDAKDEPLTSPPSNHPYYEGRRKAAQRALEEENKSKETGAS